MRPLVITTFLSLDGVMQGPGGPTEDVSGGFDRGGWLVPYFDEDSGAQMVDWMSRAGDFLLGRTTYDIFHAHWPHIPTDDDPISSAINHRTKHVASRTRDTLDWDTARLLDGDTLTAVEALKQRGDGELQVHGSAGLVQTLLRSDLVDELRLVVFPVALGRGKRLFGEGLTPTAFTLASSRATGTGVLLLTYRRAGAPTYGSFLLGA